MAHWRGRSSYLRVAYPALMTWASGCALFCPPGPTPTPADVVVRPEVPDEPDVMVIEVEDRLCSSAAPSPVTRAVSAARAPDGTLTVSWGNDPQEITLEVRGARLGRVLEEISRRTDQAIVGVGAPADVRVWATVRQPRPWRVLIEQLATSVGGYVVDHGDVMSVVDEASWHARQQAMTSLAPIDTGVFPSQAPEEDMAILAELALGCQGRMVWRRGDDEVYVSDRSSRHAQSMKLVEWLEDPSAEPLTLEPRTRPYAPKALTCEESGAPSDDTLGAAMLEAAAAARQELIVGCGGARRISAVRTSKSTPEALARATGLSAPSQDGVWASAEAFSVRRIEAGPKPVNGVAVSRYVSEDPERDVVFVRAMFPEVRAVASVRRGVILVMTTQSGHRAVKALLERENAS